jgi:hypothetical protein
MQQSISIDVPNIERAINLLQKTQDAVKLSRKEAAKTRIFAQISSSMIREEELSFNSDPVYLCLFEDRILLLEVGDDNYEFLLVGQNSQFEVENQSGNNFKLQMGTESVLLTAPNLHSKEQWLQVLQLHLQR